MIKISSILLTITFFFILMKPAVPFIEYVLRYDFIIENLCINREKPEIKCNGKCHLNKQLQKEAEKSQSDKIPFRPKKNQIDLLDYLKGESGQGEIHPHRSSILGSYITDYSFQYVSSIFHPPNG